LAVTLELAGHPEVVRERLCVVDIAGTFVPCNGYASEWFTNASDIQ
jgi:hypothetical protein